MGRAETPGVVKYVTPERVLPFKTPAAPWELCQTLTEYWGYVPQNARGKDAAMIVKILSEVIARGGNLLLNIAPGPNGTLSENEVNELGSK